MRPASVSLLLALLLALAGGLVPAALPGAPVPAALAPVVALAADDIEITTATRYRVEPEEGRIRVIVDVTAVNRKPNRVSGGTVTRYFYDGVNLGIQPEARNLRATQDGGATGVDVGKRKGFRLVAVAFRENIYFGQTAKVRLAFDLPGGEPRSESDVRVGEAFTTFTAWAFGDTGTVRIEVPSSYRVELSGAALEPAPGADGQAAWTASTSSPIDWYAWVNATDATALTRDRLTLAGGDEVVIRGWPEDARWRTRVRTLLRDGVPELVDQVGLAWPVEGALTVTEVHTPLLEGYAGFYDAASDAITISEDLDEMTIVHEASHAWFNKALFTERWITEGLADEYSARVLRELGRGYPGPGAVKRKATAAFPLAAWPPPAPIESEEGDAREQYGYDASWLVMRKIVKIVGADGMREIFGAAADGTTAYLGDGPPERSRLPNDWRRFLDLADELGARPGVEDLLATWVLDATAAKMLPVRAEARRAYSDLARDGGSWTPPLTVRMAMDRWTFADATGAMETAASILATRDEIGALADAEGLDAGDGLRDGYEDAASVSELAVLDERARVDLVVLGEVAAAADAVEAPRDWLTDLGLDGADPAAALGAARNAWEAGDVEASRATAADAVATLAAAPAAGRTKAITYGAGGTALVVVVVGLIAIVVVRRRGAEAHRVLPAASTPPGGGPEVPWRTDPEGAGWTDHAARPPAPPGPYATLPPDAPPADPPGGPPSSDEGAERS
ncbi:MAG TPA: hypothetical protein VES19_06195 [Candidatus Limnocylindrales bacterium]|nr:hypothetical protein [Candidatus Limnocylindrales bacterium]